VIIVAEMGALSRLAGFVRGAVGPLGKLTGACKADKAGKDSAESV
jgi:hypothetical protein